MQHAAIWAEKLQAQLKNLRAPATASASKTSSEQVIVGDLSRARTLQERARPEIEEARRAVTQISDLVEAAERRAERADEELQTVTEFTRAQLHDSRTQAKASDDVLAAMRAAAEAAAAIAAEQLRSIASHTVAAQNHVEELEEQAAAASVALSRTEKLVIDAQDHVLAAEASASESKRDIQYLEAFIREQFGCFSNNALGAERAAA